MSTDSFWTENRLGQLITDILRDAASGESEHHFGPSFVTAYQLAILVKAQCPRVFQRFGHPVGGQGAGDHLGFAGYIARQLSQRTRNGDLPNVEGKFLSYLHDPAPRTQRWQRSSDRFNRSTPCVDVPIP